MYRSVYEEANQSGGGQINFQVTFICGVVMCEHLFKSLLELNLLLCDCFEVIRVISAPL